MFNCLGHFDTGGGGLSDEQLGLSDFYMVLEKT